RREFSPKWRLVPQPRRRSRPAISFPSPLASSTRPDRKPRRHTRDHVAREPALDAHPARRRHSCRLPPARFRSTSGNRKGQREIMFGTCRSGKHESRKRAFRDRRYSGKGSSERARAAIEFQSRHSSPVTRQSCTSVFRRRLAARENKTAEPFRARLFVNCCFGWRLAPKFFGVSPETVSIIHAAHSARRHRRSFFLFRNLRDQCFGGEQQARDGRSVLQRGARDFGRIDDTRLHQVGVFVIRDVVTFVAFALLHFLNDERAFAARVVSKLTRRLFNGTANNRHADFFIAFEVLDVVERFL